MQKCPKCLAEQNNVNSSACYYCGADMSEAIDSEQNSKSDDYLSEENEYIPEQNISLPDSDELGIETTADLVQSSANDLEDIVPIEEKYPKQNNSENENYERANSTSSSLGESQKIKKLSDSEVKEIEKNLYKSDDYFNNKEKNDLIEKINSVNSETEKPFTNTPIDPHNIDKNTADTPAPSPEPVVDLPKPQKAKKGQGLAYFYNSYIQIKGSQKLHTDDILSINNREYVLKPKNFNKKIAIYSAAAVLVLVVAVIGSFIVGNSNFGNGQVFGVILDEFDTPFIEGATVKFSELGLKTESDAQGLFTFSNIPTGSHKIEYLVDNNVVGSDYLTIADNRKSFITLKPNEIEETAQIDPRKQLEIASKSIEKKEVNPPTQKKQVRAKKKKTIQKPKTTVAKKTTSKKKTNTTTSKQKTGYGKLALKANVEGAKIKVDGSVLGAGNLTYSKIKTGSHKYTVSLDGYESKSGTFTIQDGKTKTISPSLKPLTQAKKEETFKQSDYFYSAENAFNQGEYKTAISDYNKVIKESPSTVEAYYGLAESYSKLKMWEPAYDNYIKAAEIYQFKGNPNSAITCYNNAIDVDSKKTTAYLGRGKVYFLKGEYRAAMGDYDKVVKLDKRNFGGYYGMGETSFKLQRYSMAIEHFKDARSLDGDNPLIHQYLTLSYMFENDHKNSRKCFEKFNEYASENEKNKFKQNSSYAALKKYIDTER